MTYKMNRKSRLLSLNKLASTDVSPYSRFENEESQKINLENIFKLLQELPQDFKYLARYLYVPMGAGALILAPVAADRSDKARRPKGIVC